MITQNLNCRKSKLNIARGQNIFINVNLIAKYCYNSSLMQNTADAVFLRCMKYINLLNLRI